MRYTAPRWKALRTAAHAATLNCVGLWVDDLAAAVAWTTAQAIAALSSG